MHNLLELVAARALQRGDAVAYRFLGDGDEESQRLSFVALAQEARGMAACLRKRIVPGTRVLLLYPSGLEFVTAFMAVLHAGGIAVALPPPPADHADPVDQLVQAVCADCAPEVALVHDHLSGAVDRLLQACPALHSIEWLVHSECLQPGAAATWQEPMLDEGDVALLQYTSGSTARPKGVRVTHGNLLSNLRSLEGVFGDLRLPERNVGVSWLPMYHDMGLIGGLLMPLYASAEVVLMSPQHFAARPVRWLRAITRYGASFSGGPNTAYELCLRGIPAKAREGLDLRHWLCATNGSEPLQASTLRRFHDAFTPFGFDLSRFRPCYGLAEASLLVTASRGRPRFLRADDAQHELIDQPIPEAEGPCLVSSGQTGPDIGLRIVDRHSRAVLGDGEVGEIEVAGPAVSPGYWGEAATAGSDPGAAPGLRWLATGDLGLTVQGELFVTGRLKDLIIVAGRNLFPQDIEVRAQALDERIKPGLCVAVASQAGGSAQLHLLAEVAQFQSIDPVALCRAIRQDLYLHFHVPVHTIAMLPAGAVLRTPNGKLRRAATLERFERQEMTPLFVSTIQNADTTPETSDDAMA